MKILLIIKERIFSVVIRAIKSTNKSLKWTMCLYFCLKKIPHAITHTNIRRDRRPPRTVVWLYFLIDLAPGID